MPSRIVAAAADDDEVVRAGAAHRRKALYPALLKCGFPAFVLEGENDQKQRIDDAMSEPDVRLFTGLGHGSAEVFAGQHRLPIYSAESLGSAPGIQGRIFHLCSCSAAKKLGPALLSAGATAFFGYAAPVLVNFDEPSWLYQADSEIDIALASGSTCAEALVRAEDAFEQAIYVAEANNSPRGVRALFGARIGLRGPSPGSLSPAWGNPSARL
jgi:hypothetical protein